jgi:hypothetical protein
MEYLGAVIVDVNAGHPNDVAYTAFTNIGTEIIGKHTYQLKTTLSRAVLRW